MLLKTEPFDWNVISMKCRGKQATQSLFQAAWRGQHLTPAVQARPPPWAPASRMVLVVVAVVVVQYLQDRLSLITQDQGVKDM